MRSRKPKKLSAEDRALWARVTKGAAPLHSRPRSDVEKNAANTGELGQKKATPAFQVKDFQIGDRAPTSTLQPHLSPSLIDRLGHSPVKMDHGTYRQMSRGKLKPEARIDLHGLTLADAHPRLTQFIQAAYADQKRLVLVITGKGKDREDPGPIPIRRGVLRHQVPGWLMAPPLGALVLDIRPAHLRHGGEGAYYVYLKRRR